MLAAKLDECGSKVAVYYMAIPPDMFPTVAEALASGGLNERGRIVVEKPFGRDLESARKLNEILHDIFPEERIFRIDHYLGKEAVEDLLVFRFSNMLLEPVWNRNYVRSVQVTMAETIGVEGRGAFYETVGAIRDVLQNHALQIVTPAGDGTAGRPGVVVPAGREGQGPGGDGADRPAADGPRAVHRLPRRAGRRSELDRRDVRRRALDDRLVALGRRAVVRPRRQGVGARRLGGRRRAARAAATAVRRGRRTTPRPQPGALPPRQARRRHVRPAGQEPRAPPRQPGGRRQRRLRRRPRRAPGRLRAAVAATPSTASPRRFAREDVVERTWRVVQPALDDPGPIFPYFRGTMGPAEADRILDGDTWFQPS